MAQAAAGFNLSLAMIDDTAVATDATHPNNLGVGVLAGGEYAHVFIVRLISFSGKKLLPLEGHHNGFQPSRRVYPIEGVTVNQDMISGVP